MLRDLKKLILLAVLVPVLHFPNELNALEIMACDEGQINPRSRYDTINLNLDQTSLDWGAYCESLPTWSKGETSLPSLDGSSLRLSLTGGASYSNVHFYRNFLPCDTCNSFYLETSFWFDSTTCNNQLGNSLIQALEFTISKWQDLFRYEIAIQWMNVGIGGPEWRYWNARNTGQARWVPFTPPITQCLEGRRWHTLGLYGYTLNGRAYYSYFVIDQQRHDINLWVDSIYSADSNKIAIGVQLDGNNSNEAYSIYIDRVTLRPTNIFRVRNNNYIGNEIFEIYDIKGRRILESSALYDKNEKHIKLFK